MDGVARAPARRAASGDEARARGIALNVLVVSGMWPPDVGGPASHAPEVCGYLLDRGHRVAAVTMADRPPAPERYPVGWASRRTPLVWRHLVAARVVARAARQADVVYTTGMIGRSSLGAALARKPVVLKLTSDPVFERSLPWRLWGADLGGFQHARGLRIGVLRHARDLALARATRVIIPSEALRELALGWGLPPEKVVVIPNPISPPTLDDREELRRGADAALLSSSWENFPHMVVEALSVGTPVLSTDVGGVTEILRDGENGLLVPMNDAEALAGAIRRYFDDEALQERLRAATVASVTRFAPEAIYARLEALLEEAASGHVS